MYPEIKKALDAYKLARAKTYEFLKTVPQEKLIWRPHAQLGTFGMQLRHMTKVQQAYINGIKKGTIDFSDKTFSSELETSKVAVLKKFKELDQELVDTLRTLKPNTQITFKDGIRGTSPIDIVAALSYLAEHEFYHQGIFTCYGRLAELGKFRFM